MNYKKNGGPFTYAESMLAAIAAFRRAVRWANMVREISNKVAAHNCLVDMSGGRDRGLAGDVGKRYLHIWATGSCTTGVDMWGVLGQDQTIRHGPGISYSTGGTGAAGSVMLMICTPLSDRAVTIA